MIPQLKKPTANGVISFVTGLLILLIAIGSFALSYNNLHQTALSYGVDSGLAIIWPLLIDFALIVFSLAVVRASLYSERTWWPWLLVALYTVGTLSFNILHAPDNLTAQVVAVVAPLSLFLSFETLMAMLKNGVKRSNFVQSLADLTQQMAQKTRELADFEAKRRTEIEAEATLRQAEIDTALESRQTELDTLSTRQATLQSEIDKAAQKLSDIQRQVEAKQKELDTTQDTTLVNVWDLVSHIEKETLDTQTRQAFVALLTNAKVSQKDIAEWAGVNVKTVQRDIAACNGLVKRGASQ